MMILGTLLHLAFHILQGCSTEGELPRNISEVYGYGERDSEN